MNAKRHLALLAALAAMIMSGLAMATEVTVFESCVDGRGRTLAAEADTQQAMLVRTVVDDFGQAKILYNPGVLPRLTFNARLFLYSHECARHGLGDSGKTISAARARVADCMAANTLLASNLLKPDDLPGLQAELSFTEAEWRLLPGPMRNFDLANCASKTQGNVLKLPLDTPPSAKQTEWNACERACADKLWTCQKGCRGAACGNDCMATHDQCRRGCRNGDKPTQ